MMLDLQTVSFEITGLPIELVKVRVVEYFEGERLVEYRSKMADEPYVEVWTDADGLLYRVTLFRVLPNSLQEFLACQLSLRQLILSAPDGHVYIIEAYADQKPHSVRYMLLKDFPAAYLPLEDSFYDQTLTR